MDEAIQSSRRAVVASWLQKTIDAAAVPLCSPVDRRALARLTARLAGDVMAIWLHEAWELLGGEPAHLRSVTIARVKLRQRKIPETPWMEDFRARAATMAKAAELMRDDSIPADTIRCVFANSAVMHAKAVRDLAEAWQDTALQIQALELFDAASAVAGELQEHVPASVPLPLPANQ